MDIIAKYEVWQSELEERRTAVITSRRRMRVLLALGIVAFPVGYFAWGFWYGLGGLFLFLSLFVTGAYIASMYEWDYIRKAEATRTELERLRRAVAAGQSAEDAARDGTTAPPPPDEWVEARVPRKLLWGARTRR